LSIVNILIFRLKKLRIKILDKNAKNNIKHLSEKEKAANLTHFAALYKAALFYSVTAY